MDYRDFELANERCKPKHFGPATALQRRLARDSAHRFATPPDQPGVWRRLVGWLRRKGASH